MDPRTGREGKLTIINPPSAFLLQNKAVQAGHLGTAYENHPFFTKGRTYMD